MKIKKNSLYFISLLVLINILVISVIPFGHKVNAEGEMPKDGYFVIEKAWKNDADADGNPIEGGRPSSINICIEGSDGSSFQETLTARENWKKTFKLPTKDASNNQITYTVYEVDELEKYKTDFNKDNKLTIKYITTGSETDSFVVNNTSGFAAVPSATVRIRPELKISLADVTMPENFVYTADTYVYTDAQNSSVRNHVDELISYTGALEAGDSNIPGEIVMVWPNQATDLQGNTHDVRITLSNIVIRALASMEKGIAVLAYNGRLNMQSYVTSFTGSGSSNIQNNLVGVKADIAIEVLGLGEGEYVQVLLDDIDVPDYVDYYKERHTLDNNNYYGLQYPYSESITIKGLPSSDVYINNGTTYLVYDNEAYPQKFASRNNKNDSSLSNHFSTLEYLAPASKYEFTWTGSDCGTTILMDTALPESDTYNNVITNVSSLYVVRYFYQLDDGTYKSTPDETSELRMVAPGSEVEVSESDKTPAEAKAAEGYFLDSRDPYITKYKGTTDETNTVEKPLELDVYFRKQYRVIYHDNVGDIVWKPETQTNLELDYGVATPGFDTDKTTEDIQPGDPVRQGYKFLGWSEEPESEIITVPTTVTKNADYWAHWEPDVNKYKVAYYYEVNGKYPSTPDFVSSDRPGKTEEKVAIIESDKVPQKADYYLNSGMTAEWTGTVLPDGTLVLKVYFKQKAKPSTPTYVPPVTGIE